MSNNELYEHKRSDTVKWVLTLFAFILVGVMFAGVILGWFDKKEEPPAEEEQTEQAAVTDGEGNAMDEDIVYPMPEKMSFSAAAFAQPLAQFGEPSGTTVTSPQSVDVRIEAYVYPESAANKAVDFSVAWGNAPTHGSEQVSNYLTVTPDSDGSTTATVSCKKSFGDDTIIITVTTREGGYTATCTVSFTGIASGIEITSSTATKKSTSARGEYYELGTSKTYTFDIGLTNAFDDAAGDLTVTEIGGVGDMYFGNGSYNDGGYINFTDMVQKSIGEFADECITSATISGNTLTVKTGSKILENYYSSYGPDEYFITDIYYDRYVIEISVVLAAFQVFFGGFLQAAQKPFVCVDFLHSKPQRVESIFIVVGDAVFVIGEFGKEHLADIPVAGFVCGDGGFLFPLVPVEHFVESGMVAFADIAAETYGIDLVRIVYAQAPVLHHVGKLFLAETGAEREGVYFFLLSVLQFAV